MDREQAVKYLQSSGFSEEQIKAIEGAFTCDKCVYSTSEGCQYDDITEAIPPVDPQPKTGYWIEDAGTYYKAIHERGCEPDENTPIFLDDIACSECLAKFSVIDNETERFECCPHCGAKMLSHRKAVIRNDK